MAESREKCSVSKREPAASKNAFSAPPASRRELEFLLLGRTLRMSKKIFLVFVLLLATAAVAATSDSSSQPVTTTPAIRHYLMPDYSFRSVFVLDAAPQSEIMASQPANAAAAPATQLGFCACGCGIRCTTSADCGSNACRPFITCCARKTQNPEADWFTRSFESSSHKTPLPDSLLKVVLKAECK